ncbi:MAG: rod shape-determining protein RodA [Gammaproteobacteria bacterium]
MYEDWQRSRAQRALSVTGEFLRRLNLDTLLLSGIGLVMLFGLFVLYSASGENTRLWEAQVMRFLLAIAGMTVIAQIPPQWIRRASPIVYVLGVILLVLVALVGDISLGAQRWLDLGFVRFQPSELMKLAVPLTCAWWLHERPVPPSPRDLGVLLLIIGIPFLLIAEQPDLGTAILVGSAGLFVVFLGGLSWRVMLVGAGLLAAILPVAWNFLLHDYQRHRVLMLLDPMQDPLGKGYHIIQSQIAIGSGGVFGKGWMNGSQAQLEFLPERSTDFIFAVVGEELGLLGQGTLLLLYAFVIGRALFMALEARDTFGRLAAGSIALTFAVYVVVNAGMVSGLLPVVGVPLPLLSYGGTSAVTLLAGFGILLSIHSRRKLVR